MKGQVNIKIDKKALLIISAIAGAYAMADYVSIVDVKSSGGITVTGGVTETELTNAVSDLQTQINSLQNQIDTLNEKELPVGTIALWGSSTIPTGWVEMRGQSTSGNSELAAVFGSIVPDMRGKFARGWNNDASVDSGRTLGSSQTDQLQNITGSMKYIASYANDYKDSHLSGALYANTIYTSSTSNYVSSNGGVDASIDLKFDASRVARTGAETRPVNVALIYIVKAK